MLQIHTCIRTHINTYICIDKCKNYIEYIYINNRNRHKQLLTMLIIFKRLPTTIHTHIQLYIQTCKDAYVHMYVAVGNIQDSYAEQRIFRVLNY